MRTRAAVALLCMCTTVFFAACDSRTSTSFCELVRWPRGINVNTATMTREEVAEELAAYERYVRDLLASAPPEIEADVRALLDFAADDRYLAAAQRVVDYAEEHCGFTVPELVEPELPQLPELPELPEVPEPPEPPDVPALP